MHMCVLTLARCCAQMACCSGGAAAITLAIDRSYKSATINIDAGTSATAAANVSVSVTDSSVIAYGPCMLTVERRAYS